MDRINKIHSPSTRISKPNISSKKKEKQIVCSIKNLHKSYIAKGNQNRALKNITLDIDGKEFTHGFSLNVGNPHIVFFVKDCFKYDLKILGPKIENHELFPERTNVTFAQIDDENSITVKFWERGAGLTKACGTAACATAVAGSLLNLNERIVNIEFSTGLLKINWKKDNSINMTGNVSEIKKINVKS